MRSRRVSVAAAVTAAGVLAVFGTPAGAHPVAAAKPTGIYAGMGNCPLSSPVLADPGNQQVGCVTSVTRGGSVTIGSTTVPLTQPITLQFGVYWPASGPTVEFPDGTVANVFSTVPSADGKTLTSSPLQVPIPGLANFLPGVTSVFAQVELAGPITEFVPLATGEPAPVFRLPVKLHLFNALFGLHCYIGSNSSPIVIGPTTGTTSPPPPNVPITGDPGVIDLASDPNGFGAFVVSFSGASLVDNSVSVPVAGGCGIGGSLDWVINTVFGLPAAAGHNAVVFSQTTTSLAVDSSLDDLKKAIAASAH
ncbi:hypothetical protein AB0M46_47405 [Dactylosporangium sp. NPDC051485]|uniref:hypothetical protein n=1 Tax=Dactylosporangium sp. NPDC051485 TaxID=3154846 RepID=UPI003415B984